MVTMTAKLHVVLFPNGGHKEANPFLVQRLHSFFFFLGGDLQIEFGACVSCFQVIDRIMWRN